MNRIFIDMDGIIEGFDGYARNLDRTGDETKTQLGSYLRMDPMPGAIEAIRGLIGMGFEVWAASKPPTGVALAYSDKAAWVFKHLPELRCNLILTHDKGLLGDSGDYLIDDRPDKAKLREVRRYADRLSRRKPLGRKFSNALRIIACKQNKESNPPEQTRRSTTSCT
jgi:hypothetical protein